MTESVERPATPKRKKKKKKRVEREEPAADSSRSFPWAYPVEGLGIATDERGLKLECAPRMPPLGRVHEILFAALAAIAAVTALGLLPADWYALGAGWTLGAVVLTLVAMADVLEQRLPPAGGYRRVVGSAAVRPLEARIEDYRGEAREAAGWEVEAAGLLHRVPTLRVAILRWTVARGPTKARVYEVWSAVTLVLPDRVLELGRTQSVRDADLAAELLARATRAPHVVLREAPIGALSEILTGFVWFMCQNYVLVRLVLDSPLEREHWPVRAGLGLLVHLVWREFWWRVRRGGYRAATQRLAARALAAPPADASAS